MRLMFVGSAAMLVGILAGFVASCCGSVPLYVELGPYMVDSGPEDYRPAFGMDVLVTEDGVEFVASSEEGELRVRYEVTETEISD